MEINKVYPSKNNGDFKVIDYINNKKVKVQFIETGFITFAQSGQVRRGNIKDYLAPRVFGVGFVGIGNHKVSFKGEVTKAYYAWSGMLKRCYDAKCQERQPEYKGCSVAKEWHNFQNFAEWFDLNYQDGLHLDKDIKVKGNKIYSPDSCLFVTSKENVVEANAKHYKLVSPQGDVVEIYNLSEFARDNNLSRGSLSAVFFGRLRQHKGWGRV